MYDAREKALRDQQWALNVARWEGKAKGEIKIIQLIDIEFIGSVAQFIPFREVITWLFTPVKMRQPFFGVCLNLFLKQIASCIKKQSRVEQTGLISNPT